MGKRLERDLVAVDLETTGYEAETELIIEIGAVRIRLGADGAVSLGERFLTFADPGRPLTSTIARLTGIRDDDLIGAPSCDEAVASFAQFAFRDGTPVLVGHNVGFDISFLERFGLPLGTERLDTAEIASIVLPSASSYALQRLASDASITPDAVHRALDDAVTSALVLGHLAHAARELPALVLSEIAAFAELLGPATAEFFKDAAATATRDAWDGGAPGAQGSLGQAPPGSSRDASSRSVELSVEKVFAADGPLARAMSGYEDRPEQRDLAVAIERTFEDGGALVAEAGTGVGKSLAYAVPALARAVSGDRVIVSTHTLPLQDQLVRKDLPALQAALGTMVPIAVLKGRSNYLCPRRWQILRGMVATREEARIVCKTLVWRTATERGDRAELNLMSGESELWSRISANDESCDQRRCKRTPGGCYLQRARDAAADAGIVVVNHALLLQDARMRGALLPQAEHVVVDEAHRLEDVATDAFGLELHEPRLRRDLQRVGHSIAVVSALRDAARSEPAEHIRAEVERAIDRTGDVFAALAQLLVASDGAASEDRVRITAGLRASDERWLPVELAGERLAEAIAGIGFAADRLASAGGDEDELAELATAMGELAAAHRAIDRGIHDPRASDIVWVDRDSDGVLALHVALTHLGGVLRGTLVDAHRAIVFTSATLAVAGSFAYTLDRFGIKDIADEPIAVGSPFDHRRQALLVLPADIALPGEERFIDDAARVIDAVARALGGRTLVLFTSHASLRETATRLVSLEQEGLAVLTQGIDGSRRALLERFALGRAVLLGTQSFWEGVDMPGEMLRCVIIARLPFSVPDDPLVQGRAERYDDPFVDFQLPQAALRLRQGFGRLIRTKTDYGAVVLLDRRVVTKEYGEVLLASLPDARTEHHPIDAIAPRVAAWCDRG